jgi:hypothetical protein
LVLWDHKRGLALYPIIEKKKKAFYAGLARVDGMGRLGILILSLKTPSKLAESG